MNNNNGGSAQLVAQWITSLAISVICCAVLFVVFAGYLVDMHSSINLATVRLEVVQEKCNQMASEIAILKKNVLLQPQQAGAAQPPVQAEAPPPEAPPSTGVEISEPAPLEPNESGDMTPVMLPSTKASPPADPAQTTKPQAPPVSSAAPTGSDAKAKK